MQEPIIHIIPKLSNGGAENMLVNLSRGLSKSHKQIIIITQGNPNDYLYESANEFASIYFFSSNKKKVIDCLSQNNNSPVICWMYHSIFWIEKLSIQYKIRFHSVFWNIRHSSFGTFQIKQKFFLLLMGFYSQFVKPRIIYCGFESKRYHERYFFYLKKSKVITNRLAKKIPDDIKNLKKYNNAYLYVGRYDYIKGPDILIEVLKKVSLKFPETKLLIAGSGWNKNKIPAKLREQVILLGNYKDVFDLYNSVKALLFTSRSEGYPNVIVEASVVGCPIFALKSGDTSEILIHNELGFVFKSKKQMCNALIKNYSQDYSKKKKNVIDYTRKAFHFKKTINEYLEFIN